MGTPSSLFFGRFFSSFLCIVLIFVFSFSGFSQESFAQRAPSGSSCPVIPKHVYRSPSVTTVFYVTEECQKRPIFNPDVYFSHFASWDEVIFLEQWEIDAIPDHPLNFLPWGPRREFGSNSLLKTTDDPRVYLIVKDSAYPIESEEAFKEFGFSFDEVEDVTPEVFEKYETSSKLITCLEDAPQYLAFKYPNDPKVYYLHEEEGKIVKTYITSMEELNEIARSDRLAVLPIEHVIESCKYDRITYEASTETNVETDSVRLSLPQDGSTIQGVISLLSTSTTSTASSVAYYLGNTEVGSVSSTRQGVSTSVDTTRFSNGTYALKAVVRDGEGNTKTVIRMVKVDNPVTTTEVSSGGGGGGGGGGGSSVPASDTTAPTISSVASSTTETTATITWTTNESSNSVLEHGTSTSYGSTSSSSALVTSHSITLTGLTAETTYHFRVSSQDASSNTTQSSDYTFTTASPDITPPVISSVTTSTVSDTAATITWTANESATSTVEYGTTTGYGSTSSSSALVTSHSINLTGLTAETTYHFRVSSQDASGNVATSTDYTFTTQAEPDTTAPTVTAFTIPATATVLEVSVSSFTATDNVAVTGYLLTESSSTPSASSPLWEASATSSYTFDSEGTKTLYAWARDASGNVSTSLNDSVTITIPDTTAPTVSFSAPSDGATISGGSVALSATASDETELSSVRFYIDDTVLATDVSAPFATTLNTALYSNGAYTLSAVATDSSGNAATSTISVTIGNDVTAPTISSIATSTADTTATITWTTDEASTSYVAYGADTSYGSASSSSALVTSHSITLTGLTASTTYHFVVSSQDASGNVATSTDATIETQNELESEFIGFRATGSSFAALLTVADGATIEWVFGDGTTSSTASPSIDFGTAETRTHYLRVTPWSALTMINVGYDAADGGSGSIPRLDRQYINLVTNLEFVAPYLQIWTSNYSNMTSLNFANFVSLHTMECYLCRNVQSIDLTNTPSLRRLCVEDNDIQGALDLSESPMLEDLRAALNAYTEIIWGDTGARVWHICIRDNPQMTTPLPDLSQFPVLRELFTWNNGWTGLLDTSMLTALTSVQVYGNDYTSADLSSSFVGSSLNISHNQLTSIDISGNPTLYTIYLAYNNLGQGAVDTVLADVDNFGTSGGRTLDLRENSAPSAAGLASAANLTSRGWTVYLDETPDTTAPTISSVVSTPTDLTVAITWTTNEAATSTVEYGTTTGYGSTSSSSVFATSHSTVIESLNPLTTYHFRITSTDSAGNATTTGDYTFTTNPLDQSAPVISSVASSTTDLSAIITWTTNESATSTVEYGTTTGYGSTSSSSALVTSHSIAFEELTPGTTYHFRVSSQDNRGNVATSTDYTFVTQPADVVPPEISSVSSTAITNTSATITWTTNESATSTVEYGTTTGYGSTSSSSVFVTSHSVKLTGLTASTTYHFRVSSQDNRGNVGTGTDYTFTTTDNSDLGLNAASIEWLDENTVRITYDWTDDNQLLDWTPTANATLTRNTSTVSITGGNTNVRGMIWDQAMAVSSISMMHDNGTTEHANMYTNLSDSWVGNPYNPNPSLGHVWGNGNPYWSINGAFTDHGSVSLVANTWYQYDLQVSTTSVRARTSADNLWDSIAGTYVPTTTGRVGLGAYGGTNNIGLLIIEGDVEVDEVSSDTTAPTISSIASSTSATGATITWTTNESATSTVEYGTTTGYGSTSSSSALVTSHSINLTGLTAETTYHFRVSSQDASGNVATSTDYTFTTDAEADIAAPTISSVASSTSATGATITWTTNESATSTVEYGTTTGYGSTSSSSALVTSHSINLTGLTAETTYHFRVSSQDASGNVATSTDYTFTTASSSAITINQNSVSDFSSLTYSDIQNAAAVNIMFRHASVGGNISDALDAIASASSTYDRTNFDFQYRGNPGWAEKLTDFSTEVASQSTSYDVLTMKFCYIDYAASSTAYINAMTSLEASYPGETFVWWTMPTHSSDQITSIATFNDAIRAYAQENNKILFDLASIESHQANGTPCTNNGTENMCAEYTSDGGHLNSTGGERVAQAFWVLMSTLAGQLGIEADITAPTISSVASSASATGATITWTTNESATSTVEYGTTTGYGSTSSSSALVTSHSINLTGLTAETTYHFRVSSQDASGNVATSTDYTFTTTDGVTLGLNAASIEWIDATHIRVTYDWTDDNQLLDWTPTTAATLTRNTSTVSVTGGSTFVRGMIWNQTMAVSRITAMQNRLTTDHANIYTNLSDSWSGSPASNPNPSLSHVWAGDQAYWSINGSFTSHATVPFADNTWYQYDLEVSTTSVRARSSSNDVWDSIAGSYVPTTTGHMAIGAFGGANNIGLLVIEGEIDITSSDTTAPTISSIASSTSATGATITWTTDESATSTVEYGTTTGYGSTSSSSALVTSHSITLTGLATSTLYHFRVSSQDASGNVATSTDYTFTTTDGADLGLNAASIEWIDATHIRVTYDWTDDNQLLDWTTTGGATLTRNASTVTISNGSADVDAIIWSQTMAVSDIVLVHNRRYTDHVNVYTNIDENWIGSTHRPDPSLSHVWAGTLAYWNVNGGWSNHATVPYADETWYTYDFEVSPTTLRARSSSDNVWGELSGTYTPVTTGHVAVGSFGGLNEIGTLIIEGEITPP